MEGGKPTIVTNAEGGRTTPSVVAYTKTGERLVGQVRVLSTHPHAKAPARTHCALQLDTGAAAALVARGGAADEGTRGGGGAWDWWRNHSPSLLLLGATGRSHPVARRYFSATALLQRCARLCALCVVTAG